MNYEFPTIRNISDVLPAIEGRDEFVVAVKEGYTVINYNVMMADTFPDVLDSSDLRANHDHYEIENLHARLRRECRGIIFDTATGDIIRRPFHKFFNANEREETQDHAVDLSQSHAILEKLDGSMIAPFIVNDQLIWGTKMGATEVAEPVEDFVLFNENYSQFARFIIRRGYTPIFEWCSRKQRIVLDYKEDQLILTAIRDLTTGRYMSLDLVTNTADLYFIPTVRTFEPQSDMKSFIEYVRLLEDREGFVVRFSDGHMLKLCT
jgi:RNA ligase